MTRKKSIEFEDYKTSATFLAFAAKLKAEGEAEDAQQVSPVDSLEVPAIHVPAPADVTIPVEPVTNSGLISESRGEPDHAPPTIPVEPETEPVPSIPGGELTEAVSADDSSSAETAFGETSRHEYTSRLDESNVKPGIPVVPAKLTLAPSFSPQKATPRTPARRPDLLLKQLIPASSIESVGYQSLSELADFLLSLSDPESGGKVCETGEMHIRISPDTAHILRSLQSYLSNLRPSDREGSVSFRTDDLANYLFRQFLRSHIKALQELKKLPAAPSRSDAFSSN